MHLCGKRFVNRIGNKLKLKVYTNLPEVTLYVDGKQVAVKQCNKVCEFTLPFSDTANVEVRAGDCTDSGSFVRVAKPDKSYRITKTDTKNWQK